MNYIISVNMEKFAIPKQNILYIIIGLGVMVLGYILMTGGGSTDPDVFSYKIFSPRRIIVAPILILLGCGIEVFAIMCRKPIHQLFKKKSEK